MLHRNRSNSCELPEAHQRHHHSSSAHSMRPLIALSTSTMHLVAVPLIILSSLAVGFILVYLKEILVPFVVAMFFVYLLRPIVNCLTRPCATCCINACVSNRYVRVSTTEVPYSRIRRGGPRSKASDDDGPVPRSRSSYRPSSVEMVSFGAAKRRTGIRTSASTSATVSRHGNSNSDTRNLLGQAKTPKYAAVQRALQSPTSWTPDSGTAPPELTCCSVCTLTRCPRWLAVIVALMIAFGILSGLCLMIADAVQSFESKDMKVYQNSAIEMANKTANWLNVVFHIDGSNLLKSLKPSVSIADVVQTALLVLIDAAGNAFLIMLLVLYLLFEQSSHPPGSLRRKIDDQIQRYIGIKTVISMAVGLLCYLVTGPLLGVKLAHLFGVLTFLLNYIPNVGPVIATALPLPVIVLDPTLGTTAKLLAVALPTAIHMITGNFVEPAVFGRSLELHPVVVLMALAFWFSLWGIVGAILSIPVTAVLRIVLSHMDHPYARVMINLLEGHIGLGAVELVEQIGMADLDLGSESSVVSDGDLEEGLRDVEDGDGNGGGGPGGPGVSDDGLGEGKPVRSPDELEFRLSDPPPLVAALVPPAV